MRAVKSNDEYAVTFTLVNPQPDIVDVQWDIEAGICKYIYTLSCSCVILSFNKGVK